MGNMSILVACADGVFRGKYPYGSAAQVTFTPNSGTFQAEQSIFLGCDTPNNQIFYTLDGSTPTTSSPLYTGPLDITQTLVIKAIATAPDFYMSDVASAQITIAPLITATPTISPTAVPETAPVTVTLACSTPGAVIYFTTDGSKPTASSPQYSTPFVVSTTTTVQAVALAGGSQISAVASTTYTFLANAVAPTASPAAGTYSAQQNVTLASSTPSHVIYYTVDGSTPTNSSPTYTGAIPITQSATLKAITYASGYSPSAVSTLAYTITAQQQVATPVISPSAGTYASTVSATVTDATPGASIYVTTDGSTPTQASTKYSSAIAIAVSSVLKAAAYAAGMTASAVASSAYTISSVAPTNPNQVPWYPGYYMMPVGAPPNDDIGSYQHDIQCIKAYLAANPSMVGKVVGYSPYIGWNNWTTSTKGVYTWTTLDTISAYLQAQLPGFRFLPQPTCNQNQLGAYSPNIGQSILPGYVYNGGTATYGHVTSISSNPGQGAGWASINYNYNGNGGYGQVIARLDIPATSAAWAADQLALMEHGKANWPCFDGLIDYSPSEFFNFPSADPGRPPDLSTSGWVGNWIARGQTIRAALPTMLYGQMPTYNGTGMVGADMGNLVYSGAANGVGQSTTDTYWTGSATDPTLGQDYFTGITGGLSQIGVTWSCPTIQPEDWYQTGANKSTTPNTVAQVQNLLLKACSGLLHASHVLIAMKTEQAVTVPLPAAAYSTDAFYRTSSPVGNGFIGAGMLSAAGVPTADQALPLKLMPSPTGLAIKVNAYNNITASWTALTGVGPSVTYVLYATNLQVSGSKPVAVASSISGATWTGSITPGYYAFTIAMQNPNGIGPPSSAVNVPTVAMKVVGNTLADATGQPTDFTGVNCNGLEASIPLGASGPWDYGGWTGNASETPIRYEPTLEYFSFSTLFRFPFNPLCFMQVNPAYNSDGSTINMDPNKGGVMDYRAAMIHVILRAQAMGACVVFDYHTNSPNATVPGQTKPVPICCAHQQVMADADWGVQVAAAMGTFLLPYPNAGYEPYNEPHTTDSLAAGQVAGEVLLNGGTFTQYSTSAGQLVNYSWKGAGMQQMLTAFRSSGNTRPVFIGGNGYCSDPTVYPQYLPVDPANQMVIAFHGYPFPIYDSSHTLAQAQAVTTLEGDSLSPNDDSLAYLATLAQTHPIALTELGGVSAPQTVGTVPVITKMTNWADGRPVGNVALIGWGGSPYVQGTTGGSQGVNDQLIAYSGNATSGTVVPTAGYGTQYLSYAKARRVH